MHYGPLPQQPLMVCAPPHPAGRGGFFPMGGSPSAAINRPYTWTAPAMGRQQPYRPPSVSTIFPSQPVSKSKLTVRIRKLFFDGSSLLEQYCQFYREFFYLSCPPSLTSSSFRFMQILQVGQNRPEFF